MVVFENSGCIPAKVVVFGQKWLKVVVLGKNGCVRVKRLYMGKIGCIRAKVAVFG